MSASSASPGEALTPRAREAWTGEDDARGERKDATPRMDVRAGFLAKYSRWSHDRPCLVLTSVFMGVAAITAVVALANLAEFNTDAGDKVRRLLVRCPKKEKATFSSGIAMISECGQPFRLRPTPRFVANRARRSPSLTLALRVSPFRVPRTTPDTTDACPK